MRVTEDHRGKFIINEGARYDQTFLSTSVNKYTFRGLHFQTNPYQEKTFKVVQGSVYDFLYDIEDKSVKSFLLTPDSGVFTVGKQYAHGFLTLEPNTIVMYGVEGIFNPDTYSSIPWHSIPEISKLVKLITGDKEIFITDKDNYGTNGINRE